MNIKRKKFQNDLLNACYNANVNDIYVNDGIRCRNNCTGD